MEKDERELAQELVRIYLSHKNISNETLYFNELVDFALFISRIAQLISETNKQ